ncbi:hypothetical protein T492DRAFT_873668 [Pavlovales sp. CCMP2436]|nr:hypothetical protein T492DRAFT_873668 [Pavlovales sp. CCMP2436]
MGELVAHLDDDGAEELKAMREHLAGVRDVTLQRHFFEHLFRVEMYQLRREHEVAAESRSQTARLLAQQLWLAAWRDPFLLAAVGGALGFDPTTLDQADLDKREDFVQLAWLRALKGVFISLRDKRLRAYDILGQALVNSRNRAIAHWRTITSLTRVDTYD